MQVSKDTVNSWINLSTMLDDWAWGVNLVTAANNQAFVSEEMESFISNLYSLVITSSGVSLSER